MKIAEFKELYEKHDVSELCLMFDCCKATIYKTLKRYNIPLKNNRGRKNLKLELEE